MLLGLLLATAAIADTERAFAAAAQRDGQWTAFRTYAAPDAILFAPGLVQASTYLAGRADPAESVQWRPGRTLTACDSTLAYSSGPWTNKGGAARGSYGTIWRAGQGGWAWIYDGGHDGPAGGGPTTMEEDSASCAGAPSATAAPVDPDGEPLALSELRAAAGPSLLVAADEPMPAVRLGPVLASGSSRDRSLVWRINALPELDTGAHLLRLWSWDGRHYQLAVLDVSGTLPPGPTGSK